MAKDTVSALCHQYGEAEDLEDVYMQMFGGDA